MRKLFALVSLPFLLSACGVASEWRAIQENRKGIASLKAEDPNAAADHFIRGLAEQPFLSPFHHNLGLALDLQKKPEESMNSYRNAERLATVDDSKFYARFNLGEQYQRAKNIEEAVRWYQKALEIRPDSVEVKTNIELMFQQQQGQGQGEGKSQSQNQDGKDNKDQKDDQKDPKDQKKDGEGKDQKENKSYQPNKKYQPRPFKGELSEQDVKKILGEIKQQEQRIRAEYNRKDSKERPRDKDW